MSTNHTLIILPTKFDTLPINVEKIEDMKPGDLVFISGTYFNPKCK